MSDIDSGFNNNEVKLPMRWALKRIVVAVILVLIVLGGLAYGIYSIVNSPSSGNSSTSNAKTPATNQPAKSNPSPSTSAGIANPEPSSSSNQVQPSAGASQLTNTGPGETAMIGFIAATLVGASLHYGWRRHSGRKFIG